MHISNSQQVDIFSDDQRQLHYAELCNALYERELASLSQQKITNISLLQRKIAGLRHHVKRAAYSLLEQQSPLQVDIHNASWQAKQAAKCMANNYDTQKTQQWFSSNIQIGSSIAIHVKQLGSEHIELDSIDRIERTTQRLHTNKFGWFKIDGEFAEENYRQSDVLSLRLLKPTKAILTAACCGHKWVHKGKGQQRALSIRELLLSLSINWKTFR
ncbi:hypothetical protein [Paraglaciecola arctica]|uniref:Uncharacterized protein n=1 Tax=Paraglaciecola arctica BSs20135 TaxID=493475 RepID=K6XBX4_9ALTE|nr:hypothetical protein [Paraglaciecola arctica]GAC18139.1 hypothetical protein GARC_1159 [Paraglaciecola arctica BSs20135]